MKKYWIVFFSLMVVSLSAFAEGGGRHFSVLAGVDYNLNSASASASGNGVTATGTSKGGLGFGGGLLVRMGSIESGVFYLLKKFTTSASATNGASTSSSTSVGVIQLPVMVRIGGGGTTFGLGGFVDLSSGNDFGLTAGPRFGGAAGGMFLDLRFNYGLASGNSKDLLGMVGYAFGK